ncbi:hypothetical protein ACE38W_00510 [Chitinophaga sp. Hz27]|uniref:hypothetical protein n=1 Tax=Chitinophaga sp. Hz27 TaxID=3347169 RepID=UPI0035D586FA
MTLQEIAGKIPAEYRKELLEMNIIANAVANSSNTSMLYLFNIWSIHIEPGLQLSCGICLERILKNFKELLPILVTMEKASNLLKTV